MQGKTKDEGCYMSLNGFSVYMKSAIKARLGRDYKVLVDDNSFANGVQVKKLDILEGDSDISACIELNPFFQKYINDEFSLPELEQQIVDIYHRNKPPKCFELDRSIMWNWNKAKQRIIFQLVNKEKNKNLLLSTPHLEWNDLAIIFYFHFGELQNGRVRFLVEDYHLELWNKTVSDLWKEAEQNTPQLLPHQTLCVKGIDEKGNLSFPMYILTNRMMSDGAGCILYQGVLKEISDLMDGDLIIIPNSVDETFIIKDPGNVDMEEFAFILRIVTQMDGKPEKFLSNKAYKYVRSLDKVIC
ncbi:MAG: hypothetical protein J6A59_13570 [Lachnospiraceae bacterium]|nr:hypothetical protein [Lachnospiraceae bacterium]